MEEKPGEEKTWLVLNKGRPAIYLTNVMYFFIFTPFVREGRGDDFIDALP